MLHQNYVYQPPFEYEQPVQSTSKAKKIVLTLLLLLPLLFLLTMLILFIIFLAKQSNSSPSHLSNSISVTSQLKLDLSLPLIDKITSISSSTSCLTGTKELMLGQFPGIEQGEACKASGGDCKKGTGINPKKYSTFYNEKKLCYTELLTSEYIYGTEQECQAQTQLNKYCKSGVCVSDLSKCPINSISITSEEVDLPDLDMRFVELQSSEAYLMYQQNTMPTTPLIKLQLAYEPYCLNFVSFPKLKSDSNYPLLGVQYNGCDEYGNYLDEDIAVKVRNSDNAISDLTYEETLTSNSILYDNMAKAPYYKDYITSHLDKDKWGFYQIFRPKVGNQAICSSNTGFDNLKHVSKVGSSLLKPLFVFTLVGLILSALGLLIWIGLIAYSYTSQTASQKSLSQFLKLSHILAILVALFVIFIFIHYTSTMSGDKEGLQKGQQGFNSALHSKCYVNAKGFSKAIEVVQSFNNFILDTAYPFIITFFILALIYLGLFSILSLICLITGESPFLPPYNKNYEQ